jgi:glycosyltransferase involved in cell wall biosynthesis
MATSPWGGSEELWSRTARVLAERGHEVWVNYPKWPEPPQPLVHLIRSGARIHWRRRPWVGRSVRRVLQKTPIGRFRFARWLARAKPDLLLISVGFHTDELLVAETCRALGIRYGILVQAADPNQWIGTRAFEQFHEAYRRADRIFFVSEQNRQILEANLALDLARAEIVDNPFNVRPDARPAWPGTQATWKLACVGRMHFQSKGQDILLRLLCAPKWRNRRLQIVFWGADHGNLHQARRWVDLHGLHRQATFGGFAPNIEALWSQHHGLVLPSRYEGNSLAMLEAMLCGRVPIVTNVGRVAQLVDDNCSGFIAPAATLELVDDALERAWQRRHEWQAIGALSAGNIRDRHSLRPEEDFADCLLTSERRQTLAGRGAA